MGPIRYIVILFPVLTLLALLGFFCWYWRTQRSPLAQQLAPAPQPKRRFTFAGRCHPLARRDAIPILLITCIYAVTAFAHLGSLQAPQSAWDFGDGESATFSLPESVQVSRLWYYPNLGTGKYQVEISADGSGSPSGAGRRPMKRAVRRPFTTGPTRRATARATP